MAQWDFVVSWHDVWQALDLITSRPGTELIHDLWYKDENIVSYSSLTSEARAAITKRPSLYIKGQDFTCFPIQMGDNGKVNEERLYMIKENVGGPLLRLSIRGEYGSLGKPVIPPSMFSYDDEYFNPVTRVWERSSPGLKAAFKDIQRLMKQTMLRHKGPKGFVWIGKKAFELLRVGQLKTSFVGLRF